MATPAQWTENMVLGRRKKIPEQPVQRMPPVAEEKEQCKSSARD
tara:strand:- start:2097 stop:2228 length:132 start_codon:yes stop_codon:yes gene_type:complete